MHLRRRLTYALLLMTGMIAFSVTGYQVLGGAQVGFLQSLYMAVITLAGVGYGEVVPTDHNPALRVFNMVVVVFGVMITVYVFSVVTAFLVEYELHNIFWRRSMQKRIRELKDHFIVCGLGATGRYAVEELQKTGTPYIVVEINEDNVKRFQEHDNGQHREILYVVGDATEEKVLNEAGLDRAACVLAAVGGDKDNLVITVMVRQSNEAVRIIARCADLKYADRMTKAGANSTVSPNHIGGLRLASEALRPHVTSFLDLMLREKTRTLRIDEIAIGENSVWSGRTLAQVDLKANYNLMPLAVKSSLAAGHNDFLVNPPENLELRAGAVVIVMGDVEEVQRARRDAHHHDAAAAAGH